MHASRMMPRPPQRAAAAAAALPMAVMAAYDALDFDDDKPGFQLARSGTPPRGRASSSSASPGFIEDAAVAEAIVASLGFNLEGVDFGGVEGSPPRPARKTPPLTLPPCGGSPVPLPIGPPPRDEDPPAKKTCLRIDGGIEITYEGMNIQAIEEAQRQLARLLAEAKREAIGERLAALQRSLAEQTALVAALEKSAVEASQASDAVVAEGLRLDQLHEEAEEAAKQAAEEARAANEKEAAMKAEASKANEAAQDYQYQHADTHEVSRAAAVKLAEANRLKDEIAAQQAEALAMRASL